MLVSLGGKLVTFIVGWFFICDKGFNIMLASDKRLHVRLVIIVDIWHDRCDRRSCKILVSCVNFSENNANFAEILPKNKEIVSDFVKIYEVATF